MFGCIKLFWFVVIARKDASNLSANLNAKNTYIKFLFYFNLCMLVYMLSVCLLYQLSAGYLFYFPFLGLFYNGSSDDFVDLFIVNCTTFNEDSNDKIEKDLKCYLRFSILFFIVYFIITAYLVVLFLINFISLLQFLSFMFDKDARLERLHSLLPTVDEPNIRQLAKDVNMFFTIESIAKDESKNNRDLIDRLWKIKFEKKRHRKNQSRNESQSDSIKTLETRSQSTSELKKDSSSIKMKSSQIESGSLQIKSGSSQSGRSIKIKSLIV